ncbi:nucleoside diphosphate kinase [Heliomicrobium modesticaldum Ice1]|uniref:Nucleoside diphosphate kinase n=1 Tax=Heliobacterium modesticaldum (strain ATCC 51547 / Ice1) TaxID=498761 RepID=NDK_HELMI|nr:nucleoside-diphosphate kinase [Heliomicrobium modesticaldum]B0TBN6.1 RecName: Full=Nucleoside diphosphate kinase; Short=NDK; Short=NDP kinase; AltName: Full=Nucleoside-2-P kinase [Heliomicrobium modesticaldum Ice1]ABZ83875.1 nucleoside diphosphate kinase [Heliomicrobium modesticaldum Ice1]
MERTYLMIKPDGVQRGLVGEIISRFEKKGFKLVGMKFLRLTREMAEKHYAEHVGKPFFAGLVDYIISGPVVAMCWEGKDIVSVSREMMGATNPAKAAPGTIRGTYAVDIGRNIIHGSDSPASAERELAIYFQSDELVEWDRTLQGWLTE